MLRFIWTCLIDSWRRFDNLRKGLFRPPYHPHKFRKARKLVMPHEIHKSSKNCLVYSRNAASKPVRLALLERSDVLRDWAIIYAPTASDKVNAAYREGGRSGPAIHPCTWHFHYQKISHRWITRWFTERCENTRMRVYPSNAARNTICHSSCHVVSTTKYHDGVWYIQCSQRRWDLFLQKRSKRRRSQNRKRVAPIQNRVVVPALTRLIPTRMHELSLRHANQSWHTRVIAWYYLPMWHLQ
jgi:hypothetical protein